MLDRFGDDFGTSFQRVEYDVNLSVEQPYDEFCKDSSYAYQNEFRIALDLAMGKFNPKILKDVTDFARLTFPGKIEKDTHPDSLSDSLTLLFIQKFQIINRHLYSIHLNESVIKH